MPLNSRDRRALRCLGLFLAALVGLGIIGLLEVNWPGVTDPCSKALAGFALYGLVAYVRYKIKQRAIRSEARSARDAEDSRLPHSPKDD